MTLHIYADALGQSPADAAPLMAPRLDMPWRFEERKCP